MFVCAFVCVHVYVYLCVCLFVCVLVCMYVCVRVYVWPSVLTYLPPFLFPPALPNRYTAVDHSGLTSECIVRLDVAYAVGTTISIVGKLDTAFPASVAANPLVSLYTVSQSLASKSAGTDTTFDPSIDSFDADVTAQTALSITFAINDGRAVVRTRAQAVGAVLEVDITYRSAVSPVCMTPPYHPSR